VAPMSDRTTKKAPDPPPNCTRLGPPPAGDALGSELASGFPSMRASSPLGAIPGGRRPRGGGGRPWRTRDGGGNEGRPSRASGIRSQKKQTDNGGGGGGTEKQQYLTENGVVRNVTTRSAHPTQLGGGRAKPCRRVVLSGNTRPGRKPRRAHTHGIDRGKAPRATNTSCVTGSLLARVEGLEETFTPHPLIPSVPLGPSENPPQTFSKDPRKTLPRLPQRTLGKPSSDPLKGPTKSPLLRAHWAHNPEDGRSFEYRLE